MHTLYQDPSMDNLIAESDFDNLFVQGAIYDHLQKSYLLLPEFLEHWWVNGKRLFFAIYQFLDIFCFHS